MDQELLTYLKARRDDLKAAEAQAIHGLGVVAGRLEEVETLIKRLEEASTKIEGNGTQPLAQA